MNKRQQRKRREMRREEWPQEGAQDAKGRCSCALCASSRLDRPPGRSMTRRQQGKRRATGAGPGGSGGCGRTAVPPVLSGVGQTSSGPRVLKRLDLNCGIVPCPGIFRTGETAVLLRPGHGQPGLGPCRAAVSPVLNATGQTSSRGLGLPSFSWLASVGAIPPPFPFPIRVIRAIRGDPPGPFKVQSSMFDVQRSRFPASSILYPPILVGAALPRRVSVVHSSANP
jgi:hypothetical protein